jgi:photosystem II stability/assembly factor-like uncharacterized protein
MTPTARACRSAVGNKKLVNAERHISMRIRFCVGDAMYKTIFRWSIISAALCLSTSHAWAAFSDPENTPAQADAKSSYSPMLAVARAGNRIVAVGLRGVILISDDAAETWRQATVPVSSDLVAVTFKSAKEGWAVGHDGQVLHTVDSGNSWTQQLDGKQAATLMVSHYRGDPGNDPTKQASREEADRFESDQGGRPFLDVWFDDLRSGWVIGSFNIIFHTEDGGKSWVPWFDRVDNPNALNLHAIRRVGGDLYIVGEQGLLLKLDPAKRRFVALQSPSKGSLFGIASSGDSLIIYGLLGNAWRSRDRGQSWAPIDLPHGASVLASTELPDGRIVVANQAGGLFVSANNGATFDTLGARSPSPIYSIAVCGNSIVLAGPAGLSRITLTKSH